MIDIPERVFSMPPYSTMDWFCTRQGEIQDANMPNNPSPYKFQQVMIEAYLQCHQEMEDWLKANGLDHIERYEDVWHELQKRKVNG